MRLTAIGTVIGTAIGAVIGRGLVLTIRTYRLLLSPWLGNACRFEPTCSLYAIGAIERHGALAGGALAAGRLLRCHPWCPGGHDPVPPAPPAPPAPPRLFRTP